MSNLKNPYIYKATITNIVDGDTVDAIIDVGFRQFTTQRLRLLGIDTPELNDKVLENRDKAKQAKEYLASLILGKSVIVQTSKSDSFGRWLGTIYLDDLNINEHLIETGHAIRW
jgi:micrococcal nuclease